MREGCPTADLIVMGMIGMISHATLSIQFCSEPFTGMIGVIFETRLRETVFFAFLLGQLGTLPALIHTLCLYYTPVFNIHPLF